MLLRVLLLALLIGSCRPDGAIAHPGHGEGDHAHDRQAHAAAAPGVAFGEQELPAGMLLPQAKGPRPWTSKPVLNDPDRFQIAIMTDRTGGHRPGVWMDAVRKLNLLRPQFVVSVGDLIEGYTEDRTQLEREWKEFLGFVDQLDMRFFFVAGNHDVTNPVMHRLWRQKFGDEWYSFDYRGVHFVCLCSEDPVSRIGEAQLGWLREDLRRHRDARWTLVFLHKPLWTYAERATTSGNPDTTNWKRVEGLLAGRPHTVFAGHVHHYVQYTRNGGMRYYSLATTGGGSRLRGDAYGEFDHVMWLTMERDGPRLAVLKLDGVLPPGVVTEEAITRFNRFLQTARLEVAPILVDGDSGFDEGDIHLRLVNQFGEQVTADCTLQGLPLDGLTVSPAGLSLSVGPTGTAERAVRVRFAERVDLDRLAATTLTARLATAGDAPLRAEVTVPVVIDRRHTCPRVERRQAIEDPDPAGIPQELPYSTPAEPLLLGDATGWKGPADASFAFATSHDAGGVDIVARVCDERLVEGDRLEVRIDGRTLDRRLRDPRQRFGTVRVAAPAPVVSLDPPSARWGSRRGEPVEGAEVAVAPAAGGYLVRITLPKNVVTYRQGDEWHSFQLAIIQHDADEPGAEPTRVLWRGSRDYEASNRGYGFFVRGE